MVYKCKEADETSKSEMTSADLRETKMHRHRLGDVENLAVLTDDEDKPVQRLKHVTITTTTTTTTTTAATTTTTTTTTITTAHPESVTDHDFDSFLDFRNGE